MKDDKCATYVGPWYPHDYSASSMDDNCSSTCIPVMHPSPRISDDFIVNQTPLLDRIGSIGIILIVLAVLAMAFVFVKKADPEPLESTSYEFNSDQSSAEQLEMAKDIVAQNRHMLPGWSAISVEYYNPMIVVVLCVNDEYEITGNVFFQKEEGKWRFRFIELLYY